MYNEVIAIDGTTEHAPFTYIICRERNILIIQETLGYKGVSLVLSIESVFERIMYEEDISIFDYLIIQHELHGEERHTWTYIYFERGNTYPPRWIDVFSYDAPHESPRDIAVETYVLEAARKLFIGVKEGT